MPASPPPTPPVTPRPPVRGWWATWWNPVLQLVLLASITITAAAQADVLRAQAAADLAAENGAGPMVALAAAPRPRHAAPFAVSIPRLKITSRLVDLHRTPKGTLEVPLDVAKAGWYVNSAHPGDRGPTVIAGHVDDYRGPGVFYKLSQVRKGDRILISRADGSTAPFTVQKVLTVAKRAFPTSLVYRGDGRPSLRLITCGGTFDRKTGHYRDNLVVLATPALSRSAS